MKALLSTLTVAAGLGLWMAGPANAFLWQKMPAGCVLEPTGLAEPVLAYNCPGVTGLVQWVVNPVRGGGGPSVIPGPEPTKYCAPKETKHSYRGYKGYKNSYKSQKNGYKSQKSGYKSQKNNNKYSNNNYSKSFGRSWR